MTHLKYNRGDIRCSFGKGTVYASSQLSSWGAFETHINSLTPDSDPVYVISVFEGKKVKATLKTSTEIDWGNIDSSLWNAVKAEINSL